MRVRNEHWQLLLNICTSNPELITNKFNGAEERAKANALWLNVTNKLNSLGYGEKTVDGWRKTLTDWKSKTKSKAAALKSEMQKTGGGPNLLPPLSGLEEKLLSIMGAKCVSGDENVPELGFGEAKSTQGREQKCEQLIPEESEPSTSTADHDYVLQSTSSNVNKKRKLESAPQAPKVRRRPNQAIHLSHDLLRLNTKTVNFLENISDNTEKIASNMENIANALRIISSSLQGRLF